MGRVVRPTPTPLSSGRVAPTLVASYDMHGRAVTGKTFQVAREMKDTRSECLD